MENHTIFKIAKEHQATPSQVLIAWQIQRGNSVIPKSTHEKRIVENLMSQYVTLSQADREVINSLDHHYRYLDGSFWEIESSPYTAHQLWL